MARVLALRHRLAVVPAPLLRGACLPLVLLLSWFLASRSTRIHSPIFVSPDAVWNSARVMIVDGELGYALAATMGRYATGIFIGVGAGLAIGLTLGLSRHTRLMFGPAFNTLKQISLFAWVPLIMAWFGLNETSKIVFIALAGFFPVLLGTLAGVGGVPREFVELVSTYEYTRRQLLRRVVLPAALPAIFAGVHVSLIYAWLATLGAEYLMTSGKGLGSLLLEGQENFRLDRVLPVIVVVAIIGLALASVLGWLEGRLLHWKNPAPGLAR